MTALTEIGTVLERLGQKLQSREVPREPITPYEHAIKLWETIAPGRKIDPVEAVYLQIRFADAGIKTGSVEQDILVHLLHPYRSLFPDLDGFTVSLSVSNQLDDVSFKLVVFAHPPSPRFNQERRYPVFAIRELPEARRNIYGHKIPYNLLILGEGELYTGRLNRQLVGFNKELGSSWEGFEEWPEEPPGDVEWRRKFAGECLRFFTKIAETEANYLSEYNRRIRSYYKAQEKSVPWWGRTWEDRLHPGAVIPDALELYHTRVGLIGHAPSRLIAWFQQV